MTDMTKTQAQNWVAQEASKITDAAQARAHIEAYTKSLAFFNSPAGQASGKASPNARQARHDLAALVAKRFNLTH